MYVYPSARVFFCHKFYFIFTFIHPSYRRLFDFGKQKTFFFFNSRNANNNNNNNFFPSSLSCIPFERIFTSVPEKSLRKGNTTGASKYLLRSLRCSEQSSRLLLLPLLLLLFFFFSLNRARQNLDNFCHSSALIPAAGFFNTWYLTTRSSRRAREGEGRRMLITRLSSYISHVLQRWNLERKTRWQSKPQKKKAVMVKPIIIIIKPIIKTTTTTRLLMMFVL